MIDGDATRPRLRHRSYRRIIKKQRRKRKRQAHARARDEREREEELALESSPSYIHRQADLVIQEELQREADERRRERLHQNWLAREILAQIEFEKRKTWEAEVRRTREEQTRKIQAEWESLQRREKEELERKEAATTKKRETEAALFQEATKQLGAENGPWHNPPAPQNYGTERDKQNCPFFIKIGACRFGDRCSRIHPKPTVSCTLLIHGMFSHFSIDQAHRDEYDTDIGLEFDDKEFMQHFREFYEDVLPEFKQLGQVVQFKVCRNFEPHLRGNVYVQYTREEDTLQAFLKFNGRFYAGKQLSCEFSSVTKWKSAICGLYMQNRCPKGKTCNFLHVFSNPNNEFFDADRDLSPSRGTPRSTTRRSYRPSDRRCSPSHSLDRSRSPQQGSRRSSYSRDHSRERSHRSAKSSRSHSRSTERSASHRSRRRSSTPSSDHEEVSLYRHKKRRETTERFPKAKDDDVEKTVATNGEATACTQIDQQTFKNGSPCLENVVQQKDTEKTETVDKAVSVEDHSSSKNRHPKKAKKRRHHKCKGQKSKRRHRSTSSSSS